jgi:hypothetical protein
MHSHEKQPRLLANLLAQPRSATAALLYRGLT